MHAGQKQLKAFVAVVAFCSVREGQSRKGWRQSPVVSVATPPDRQTHSWPGVRLEFSDGQSQVLNLRFHLLLLLAMLSQDRFVNSKYDHPDYDPLRWQHMQGRSCRETGMNLSP